jgi:hypothetical protein
MRKIYELTQKQIENIEKRNFVMPSDEQIKETAKKQHRPWGLVKRDMAIEALKWNSEYVRGMNQARVDRINGLDYAEERSESEYNLGYYRGFTDFENFKRSEGYENLLAKYQN